MDTKNIAILSLVISGIFVALGLLNYFENQKARKAALAHKKCSCSSCTDTTPNTADSQNTLTVSNGVLQPMT